MSALFGSNQFTIVSLQFQKGARVPQVVAHFSGGFQLGTLLICILLGKKHDFTEIKDAKFKRNNNNKNLFIFK